MLDLQAINSDKNLFVLPELPLITIYDDNFFVRNDYDILSSGQRNYLIKFFTKAGFKQKSGSVMANDTCKLVFPKPNRMLALSDFKPEYLSDKRDIFYFVTPTTFAECLYYLMLQANGQTDEHTSLDKLMLLIDKCPCNLELMRDINIYSDIGKLTQKHYGELVAFQKEIVSQKYKHKRAL